MKIDLHFRFQTEMPRSIRVLYTQHKISDISDKEKRRKCTIVVSVNLSRSKGQNLVTPRNLWAIAHHLHSHSTTDSSRSCSNIHRLGRRFHQRTRIAEPHNRPPQFPASILEEISRSMKRGGCIGGVFASRHSLLFQANLFIEEDNLPPPRSDESDSNFLKDATSFPPPHASISPR